MLDPKVNLEFQNITMDFPGVRALEDISIKIHGGEVTALMGENGAGKSTLLKILYGDYHPNEGRIFMNGHEKKYKNPHQAIEDGISIIYQERQIVQYLSVAENVFMGKYPVKKTGLIDYRRMNKETQLLIDEFGLDIKPSELVKDLSIAHQQMVEIMKACNRSLRIIAFDEPTASLSGKEIDSLYKVIHRLKEEGKIVIYVSHRMKEIFEISDRIIVFKDGKFVSNVSTNQVDENELVRLMVGRELGDVFDCLDRNVIHGDCVLEINQLKSDYVTNVSFKLRAGEILGFAGLVGAGRSETAQAIFGADVVHGGSICFEGKSVKIKSPSKAIEMGIALCPEDRKTQGLVLQRSVKENFSMPILKRFVKKIFINHSMEKQACIDGMNSLSVKTPSIDQQVIKLSGGNQQKIIIARWLASKPKILILDEPTKGIDVGAKAEIYRLICNIAKQGIGVILISSELPELIGLSDRIIVMGQGEIKGELQRHEANEERILKYAMEGM